MKLVNDIKSKAAAIKNTFDDNVKNGGSNLYEKYINDLPSTDKLYGKKLDEFLDKRKKKKENNKDIFSELMGIFDVFLGTARPRVGTSDNFQNKQIIQQHAIDSIKVTLESSKQIISDNVKKIFFSGDGICGANSLINIDSINLRPQEFDFLNILTVDPNSSSGKIIYEPQSPDLNKQKVNRELYNIFTGGDYQFDTNNNKTLFTTTWNSGNQEFIFSGLTQGLGTVKVEEFFNDYYSSIELPDIKGIIKMSMLLTLQGGDGESFQFKGSLNKLDRLLKKLFAICGTPTDRNKLENQNPSDLFDENDEDVEFYFDFENLEGVDLEDEDNRFKRVLKFTDCGNFEVPANPDIVNDFVYLSDKKTINDLVNTTLTRAASDAQEQSGSDIPLANFNLSLINSFILNLPKALISSVFSPKIFLPIIIIYKLFKSVVNQVLNIEDLLKKLSKLFNLIIKELFWKFIREFWKRIKKDLLFFLQNIIRRIIKNKYKRYVTIITALIALLQKFLQEKIDNCAAIFGTILSTITAALAAKGGFNVPGVILGLSDKLPGMSKDRILIDSIERIEALGVNTGPIFGQPNNIPKILNGFLDSFIDDMDKNSFVKVANKEIKIPTPIGPLIIPPGILNSAGKLF
jgi:hypothetical protein